MTTSSSSAATSSLAQSSVSSPWFKANLNSDTICVYGSFTHLKRAVAKDRGEDGSGHHGEDGKQYRHTGWDDKTDLEKRTFILFTEFSVKFLLPKMSTMRRRIIIIMRKRMKMRNKLITRRADSGMWQPSSSSPCGHWGIWSHLSIEQVLVLMIIMKMLVMIIRMKNETMMTT